MRTENEVRSELLKLGKPPWRVWPPLTAAEQDAIRQWSASNPESDKRHAELEAELEAIYAETDRRQADVAARNGLHDAGVGARTIEVICGKPAPTPSLDAVREWLKSDKTWLLLSGDIGTGKSVAAAYALMQELARGIYEENSNAQIVVHRPRGTGAFRRVSAVMRMSSFDEGARELERLKSVATLVVDDLGTEHSTSWGNSLIHEIFDTRHDDRLRTIITTNIKRDALKAALGDRLADRIAQDGKVVFLEGKSMRRVPPGETTAPMDGPTHPMGVMR